MNNLKVKFGGDTAGWELAVAKVRGEAKRLAADISSNIGGRLAGMFTAGAMAIAIRRTADYAGQLTDLSARTGVAVETLQKLDRAAKENGTSLDSLVGLWERVGSAREDALRDRKGSAAKAFGALGVDTGTLKTSSPDEIVRKIAAAFQNSTNVDQLISPLRDIGGRGAGQMIALFRAGLDQQYQDMQVMTGAQADILDELGDKYDSLGQRISISLAPALVWAIEKVGAFVNKIKEIGSFIGGFVGGATGSLSRGGAGSSGKFFDDVKAAIDEGMTAGGQAALDEVARQNADASKEAADRQERIARRLQFGSSNFSGVEGAAQKAEKFTVSELNLDALSKAGLFAGGAGSGMMDNTPMRQLAVTEQLLAETKKTNGILEDSL